MIDYQTVSVKIPVGIVPLIDQIALDDGHNGRSGWIRGAILRELKARQSIATQAA